MDLAQLVQMVSPRVDADLLVGLETADDAGVYRISSKLAIIHTVDVIAPVSSDPYVYGQIAAANALSDVYAMGGRPLTALNLCFFPVDQLEMDSLGSILRGGLAKLEETRALLVGGHTVRDTELKYGMSVVGLIHPDRIIRNTTASAGDKIILTKRIGTGVHITAAKRGRVSEEEIKPVIDSMRKLNKIAAERAVEFEVRSGTDITGFGLAGHSLEMSRGSKVGIRIQVDEVPRFQHTLELIAQGIRTGLTESNRQFVAPSLRFRGRIEEIEKELFYDPQTSGGLMLVARYNDAERLVRRLRDDGLNEATIIGECFASESACVEIVR